MDDVADRTELYDQNSHGSMLRLGAGQVNWLVISQAAHVVSQEANAIHASVEDSIILSG